MLEPLPPIAGGGAGARGASSCIRSSGIILCFDDYEWRKLPRHHLIGDPDAAFVDGFDPSGPCEIVCAKRRYSAFFATDLALFLREQRIDRVIIAGVKTNVCIRATAQDAFAHGFDVVIPREATNSNRPHLAEPLRSRTSSAISGLSCRSIARWRCWREHRRHRLRKSRLCRAARSAAAPGYDRDDSLASADEWPRLGGSPAYVASALVEGGLHDVFPDQLGRQTTRTACATAEGLARLEVRTEGIALRSGRTPICILAYQPDGACHCLYDPWARRAD